MYRDESIHIDAFLTKPIAPAELLRATRSAEQLALADTFLAQAVAPERRAA